MNESERLAAEFIALSGVRDDTGGYRAAGIGYKNFRSGAAFGPIYARNARQCWTFTPAPMGKPSPPAANGAAMVVVVELAPQSSFSKHA